MRSRLVLGASLLLLPIIGYGFAQLAEPEEPRTFRFPVGLPQVTVSNFPNPQNVAGTINVGNLPAVTSVSGTVNVGNLPPVQNVSGTLNIANLPIDANGNVRVAVLGESRFRFVGITTQMFGANAGRAAMTAACYAAFPGSRMAFSDEYATTVNPPSVSQTAWIQPRPVANSGLADGSGHTYLFDAVGNLFSVVEMDCDSWSQGQFNSGGGLLPSGQLTSVPCAAQRPVACAAP